MPSQKGRNEEKDEGRSERENRKKVGVEADEGEDG